MNKKVAMLFFLILFILGIAIGYTACPTKGEVVQRIDFIEFMSTTFSELQYSTKPISGEIISDILAAGHMAGSSRNGQPWHFSVVRNREIIDSILDNVTDENVLIVISGPREELNSRFSVNFDCGLAAQNMFLAAKSLGLGARMYALPLPNINENLLPKLELPNEDYRAVIVLRIGHPLQDNVAVSNASPRQPLLNKVSFID